MRPYTRSPALNLPAAEPALTTVPENSLPITSGVRYGTMRRTSPRTIMLSSGFTAAVWTRTRTSCAAGSGTGMSRTARVAPLLS